MKIINPERKCLGCHRKIEPYYYFCSITCACLCGYMSVRKNRPIKDINELKDPKVRAKLLRKF